jgi:hypothetical protein
MTERLRGTLLYPPETAREKLSKERATAEREKGGGAERERETAREGGTKRKIEREGDGARERETEPSASSIAALRRASFFSPRIRWSNLMVEIFTHNIFFFPIFLSSFFSV